MSDFLTHLAAGHLYPETAVQPRPPARFESMSARPDPADDQSSLWIRPPAEPLPEWPAPSPEETRSLHQIIRERKTMIEQIHHLQPEKTMTAPPVSGPPQVIIERLVTTEPDPRQILANPMPAAEPRLTIPAVSLSEGTAVSPIPKPRHIPPETPPQPSARPGPDPNSTAAARPPAATGHRPQSAPLVAPIVQPAAQSWPEPAPGQITPAAKSLPENRRRQDDAFAEKRRSKAGQAAAPPTIQVTIGRVEVRAAPSAAPPKQQQRPTAKVMSLDEYLQQKERGL